MARSTPIALVCALTLACAGGAAGRASEGESASDEPSASAGEPTAEREGVAAAEAAAEPAVAGVEEADPEAATDPPASDPPATAAASTARHVVIGGSGDFLAHVTVLRAARAAPAGWGHVLGELGGIITSDEVAFVNLETPLSEERPPESGSPPVLGAPPEVADAMRAIGIDVVGMANNHAYDQWMIGAQRTIEALEAAGVGHPGAGADLDDALRPWITTTASGVRVAFVSVTDDINGIAGRSHGDGATVALWGDERSDDRRIGAAIEAARAEADVVVVAIHWSHDFAATVDITQRRRARFLVEHGADVILGTGPHVLQEVERLESPRGEAVCAYSLGNLVSNQGYLYRYGRRADPSENIALRLAAARDGVWLRVALDVDEGRVTIPRIEGVPLFTHNNYWERQRDRDLAEDVYVERLSHVAEETVRGQRLRAIAEALGDAVTLVD